MKKIIYLMMALIMVSSALGIQVDQQGRMRNNTNKSIAINGTITLSNSFINGSDNSIIFTDSKSVFVDTGIFNNIINVPSNIAYVEWLEDNLKINSSINGNALNTINLTWTYRAIAAQYSNDSNNANLLDGIDSTGFELVDQGGNSTQEIIDAVNTTAYIVNWSVLTMDTEWNNTGTQRLKLTNINSNGAMGVSTYNDLGYRTTIGIAGSTHPLFPNSTSVHYAPGYANHYTAIDGNYDFIWFTDPTDSHDFSALNHEVMRLSAFGNLNLSEDLVVWGAINTSDWSNVTITESQISDLSHTVNTNAGTICSLGEYLDGDTSCYDFNTSVTELLTTTYYNATQSISIAGSISGDISLTGHTDANYDSITLNITEVATSPGLDIRINFTNITAFNKGIMRYYTTALSGTYPSIQLWDYDSSSWEDYTNVVETTGFAIIEVSIFDDNDHISDGVVQMRIYKSSNGNTNNKYYIDWISISQGVGTPSGMEVDPYSVHRDGSTQLTANWDVGNFNITATEFYADSWLNATYYINSTGYIKNWNLTGYIKDWNSTGLLINWSNVITSGSGNSTIEILNAVNGSTLSLSTLNVTTDIGMGGLINRVNITDYNTTHFVIKWEG
jgi:hypothetical protein